MTSVNSICGQKSLCSIPSKRLHCRQKSRNWMRRKCLYFILHWTIYAADWSRATWV